MVSCSRPIVLGKLDCSYFTAPHSPLEKTPHNARIERDGLMAAARTLVDMATQRGGSAAKDGRKHFQVQPREPGGMPIDKSVSCGEYDIGQLKEWPVHLTVWRRCQCECVQRTRGCLEPHLGQMQVAAGSFQIRVTEQ